jgi:hypothetical protein
VDPHDVDRRLRRERAKRRARFLVLIGALVFLALFLGLSIWEKISALFGL